MNFHKTQTYKKAGYQFPSHDATDQEKLTSEYAVRCAEAIYSNWCRGTLATSLELSDRISRNRTIMRGDQDPESYQRYFFGDSNMDEEFVRNALMNIDWTPVAAAVKFVNVLLNMFDDVTLDMLMVALDEESTSKKVRKRAGIKMKMAYKEIFEQINQEAEMDLVAVEEDLPENLKQLAFMEQFGLLRLEEEVAYEAAMQELNDRCNVKEIMRNVLLDLITGAAACIREYYDPYDNKLKKEYLDIARTVIAYADHQYINPLYAGYVRQYSIVDLKNLTGWSDDTLKDIAISYIGYENNPTSYNPNDKFWNNVGADSGYGKVPDWYNTKISVLEYEYMSTNSSYFTEKKNSDGSTTTYKENKPKTYNTEKRKSSKLMVNMRYTGSWVIGTKHVFNHGYQTDVPRKTPKECGSSFHYYQLKVNKPMIEIMQPHIDGMTMAIFDLRNLQAKAPGPGFYIDVDSISELTLGGDQVNELDIVRIGARGGAMLYKGTTAGSYGGVMPSTTRPIEFYEGGFGQKFSQLLELFEFHRRQIQELIGLPDIAVAGVQKRETTLGEQQITFAASTNAVKHFMSAWVELEKQSAIHSILRLKVIAKHDPKGYEVMKKGLGFNTAEVFKIGEEASTVDIGIEIQPILSTAKKEMIMNMAMQSKTIADQGGIGITQLDMLKLLHYLDAGRIREAEFYLAYREEEEKERAHREAMERLRQQSEAQAQQKAMADESEIAKEQAMSELRKGEETHKAELEQGNKMSDNISKGITQMALEGNA